MTFRPSRCALLAVGATDGCPCTRDTPLLFLSPHVCAVLPATCMLVGDYRCQHPPAHSIRATNHHTNMRSDHDGRVQLLQERLQATGVPGAFFRAPRSTLIRSE